MNYKDTRVFLHNFCSLKLSSPKVEAFVTLLLKLVGFSSPKVEAFVTLLLKLVGFSSLKVEAFLHYC